MKLFGALGCFISICASNWDAGGDKNHNSCLLGIFQLTRNAQVMRELFYLGEKFLPNYTSAENCVLHENSRDLIVDFSWLLVLMAA